MTKQRKIPFKEFLRKRVKVFVTFAMGWSGLLYMKLVPEARPDTLAETDAFLDFWVYIASALIPFGSWKGYHDENSKKRLSDTWNITGQFAY